MGESVDERQDDGARRSGFHCDPAQNRHIHISEAHGFIYFNNPKAGCTTTKATLNTEVARRAGQSLNLTSKRAVHDRSCNPLKMAHEIGLDRFEAMARDPSVIRFAFTRDPVSRFCSAYQSKIKRKRSAIGAKLVEHLNRDDGEHITLMEFAEACASSDATRDLDAHWMLQRTQIEYDAVDWTMIGDQSTLNADLSVIMRRIFGDDDATLFDTRSGPLSNATRASDRAKRLKPELRALIEKAYAADFDMIAQINAKGLRPAAMP